ncbi:MAG: 50S ribosomal protein L21 [bacterium]|nr:50S ribosomal protein L21 [bacterium]
MYAIVNIQSLQFRVEPDHKVRVPLIDGNAGDQLTFDEVLLLNDGAQTTIGAPRVAGAAVTAEILGHGLADKVHVFKKKKRQNYRRNRGHRQAFTEIRITGITA